MTEERKAIHPDYQKYMDWAYWFAAYCQRGDAPFFSSLAAKTSEDIMNDVLSRKPLYAEFRFYGSLEPLPYDGVLIEPIFHRNYEYDTSLRGKIRELLCQNSHVLTDFKCEETEKGRRTDDISAHNIEIIGIDCEHPLEAIQEEIEILWLENNGLAEEAYLKRIALRLGVKVSLSGPYLTRAAGLWLWDYKASGEKNMTRAFRQRYKDNDVLSDYEDSELRFFYRVTNESIKNTTSFQ